MTRFPMVLLAVLALALPATAAAQSGERNAPPGNSAIDEYVETVPGASGDRVPRKPSGEAPVTNALPVQERQALEQQGPEGKLLADLVDATAPPAAASAPKPAAGQARVALEQADAQSASPLRATLVAAVGPNDAGGLGILFPVLLLASLVGMVTLGVRRRRLTA